METADITGLLQGLCIKTQVRTQVAGDAALGIYCFPHPNAEAPEPGKVQQNSVSVFSLAWRIQRGKKKDEQRR